MFVKRLAVLAALCFSGVAWATPDIHHWTLANGVRVYYVESHALPMLQVNVVFDAGSARDPDDRHGVAAMTAAMLSEGAAGRDADAIAAAFDDLGAEFSTDSQRDTATLSLRSLSERRLLDPAIAVLRDVLLHPDFPLPSLERERQRALVGLRYDAQSPGTLAEKTFYRTLYGHHPYAHDPRGDREALLAMTRDDLLAFHRRFYTGRNAVLTLVGDITPAQARDLAGRLAGALPAGEAAPPLPAVNDLTAARQQHVEFPSSQTHLLVGQPGIDRKDPDYFPLYVANYILGGGALVSRLAEEIREKRGLAYSVYSYFLPMARRGPFIMGLQTRNDQAAQALRLVDRTLTDYRAHGPTAEELTAAKRHLTGSFPLRIDSNKNIAQYLAVIGFYDLPLDYLDTFIPRINAVTADQIRDALQRRIDPQHLVTVSVGRAAPARTAGH